METRPQLAVCWAGRQPGRALALSAALHLLFLVTPLPEWLTAPPAAGRIRLQYNLAWARSQVELPSLSPKRAQRQKLSWPRAQKKKNQPALPAAADRPQAVRVNPLRPNHPTQTLLARFPGKATPSRPAEAVRLPEILLAPQQELSLPANEWLRLATPVARLPSPGGQAAPPPSLPERKPGIKLENVRLDPVAARPRVAAAPPDPQSPVLSDGDWREPSGLPGGLLALNVEAALPRPPLEIPTTRLQARLALGARGSQGEEPLQGEPALAANGIVVPDVFVEGSVLSSLAIAGPAPAPPPKPEPTNSARSEVKPAQPSQTPQERAQALLAGAESGTLARPVYTSYLTLANLTSQSSIWRLRYAELAPARANGSGASSANPISAPTVVSKVDPCYPAQAGGKRVEGTVVLYAVIGVGGNVEEVVVVRGVEERLDQSAATALARSRFEPARKQGRPIAVEAIVEIPFRLAACL